MLAALFPWLTVFGGLGVFMRVSGPGDRDAVSRRVVVLGLYHPRAGRRAHQVLLLPLALPAPVKFLIVADVAIAVSLLSYEYIVRRSLVGELINGARKRTAKRGYSARSSAGSRRRRAGGGRRWGLVFPGLLLGE